MNALDWHAHRYDQPTLDDRFKVCACGAVMVIPKQQVPAQLHSPTSVEAARSLTNRSEKRQKVYEAIRRSGKAIANPVPWGVVGGLTDTEIAEVTGLSENTARPRRVELVRDGLVIDSGMVRKSKSNRACAVWVVVM